MIWRVADTTDVIGAGGIGSWLMHALVRPAEDSQMRTWPISTSGFTILTRWTSRTCTTRTTPTDVGMKKVEALIEQLSGFNGSLL